MDFEAAKKLGQQRGNFATQMAAARAQETQSGGDAQGELQTGSWYVVQQKKGGTWKTVEYTEIEKEYVGWTSEAWCIPKGETVEWPVDWSWLYDSLPAGEYRIGKEIMDFQETGVYEETVIYAEFTIE